jgi:hypothetical protein
VVVHPLLVRKIELYGKIALRTTSNSKLFTNQFKTTEKLNCVFHAIDRISYEPTNQPEVSDPSHFEGLVDKINIDETSPLLHEYSTI